MNTPEARRQMEKVQTLLENLIEEFPEEGPGPIVTAFSMVEDAADSISSAIDLISPRADDEEEEE